MEPPPPNAAASRPLCPAVARRESGQCGVTYLHYEVQASGPSIQAHDACMTMIRDRWHVCALILATKLHHLPFQPYQPASPA